MILPTRCTHRYSELVLPQSYHQLFQVQLLSKQRAALMFGAAGGSFDPRSIPHRAAAPCRKQHHHQTVAAAAAAATKGESRERTYKGGHTWSLLHGMYLRSGGICRPSRLPVVHSDTYSSTRGSATKNVLCPRAWESTRTPKACTVPLFCCRRRGQNASDRHTQ